MSGWDVVRIGEVASPVARAVTPVAGNAYRQIGVKLWGEGAYERETIDGLQTKYARLFFAEAGDIIVNKIWARNGSVAVVPDSLAGCFGSGEFPMFAPKTSRLNSRWFHWLTKTPGFWAQCDEKSRGTSGKNRIKPERFLEIEIPLPPLEEQQRVVARIEELATQIQEARTLRHQATEEAEVLLRSILFHEKRSKATPMRNLVKLRTPDVTVQADKLYQFAGVYCFGRGVFKAAQKSGMDFSYARLTSLRTGEFVYPKLMAWEGALGVVPPECNNCVVSTEFPVFEVNENLVFPEVLDTYFRTPAIWPKLAGESTGTNVRRRRLNPQDFLDYEMPLPSRETQITVRKVRAEVDALKRQQIETAVELDALLPAILDRAFKGRLIDGESNILELRSIDDQREYEDRRTSIGCYIVNELHRSRSFGRTMLMKALYLSDTHLNKKLKGSYVRQAAGPYDSWINDFEKQATAQEWLATRSGFTRTGKEKINYEVRPAIQGKIDEAIEVLGKDKSEADRLLKLFSGLKTEEVEIVTTLYAVWNDFLIDGVPADDELIVKETRENWHKSKSRFSRESLKSWLNWMRSNKLIPRGAGPRTKHQPSLFSA